MYRKDSGEWLKHIDYMLLDILCLQLAYILAFTVRGVRLSPYTDDLHRNVAIFITLADVILIIVLDSFKDIEKNGYYKDFTITLRHSLILGAVTVFYLYAVKQGQLFSRYSLVMTFVIYTTLTYIARLVWKKTVRRRFHAGDQRSLLVISTADMLEDTLKDIDQSSGGSYKLAGAVVIDKDLVGQSIAGTKVVTDATGVPEYICRSWIDEVLITTNAAVPYPDELIEKLTETGVTIHLNLAKLTSIPGKRQFVEKMGSYTVLTTSINSASTGEMLIKRLMDIAGGLIGCICTGIIAIIITPMIKTASPGPVFFSQDRVGRNGKIFKMYKFRSMYMDAEDRKAELMKYNKMSDDRMFKLDFDPRVIGNRILPDGTQKRGIGDFIRRTSLDEFPQFFNVLKGDMSLVGPRPPLISETSLYELHHRVRLAIKPGLTGLWQVSGRSDITDFEEIVRLDREYITNWNLGLDIKILLKTVGVVLKKDGAR